MTNKLLPYQSCDHVFGFCKSKDGLHQAEICFKCKVMVNYNPLQEQDRVTQELEYRATSTPEQCLSPDHLELIL